MNHPRPGFLANYNSLTDKHLAGYFSNTRIRRHLQRSGLISRSGRIISEKEYRLNTMKKDHQKYIRECLAQAIFHKVLDMERHHQIEIKRKLENLVKKDRAQRIKVERSRRSAEDTHFLLSPHPPTAPKKHFGHRKLGDRGQSGHLATSPRPSTAPGNIQHPVRLQPLYSNAMAEPIFKTASSSRPKFSTCEKVHRFASGGERGLLRPTYSMDYSSGISPYQLPIINNYVIPIPPSPPKTEKNINMMKFGTSRSRRYRPTTAPNGLEQSLMKDTGKFYKPLHTNAYVTMMYLGKNVHLCHDLFDRRDEIKIYQQHCGGENVCVYRGKVLEGDTFHFTSKRHHGFPFSLTFYLNGMQVGRLSSCCEYKHRKGTRLGGKHGHFGFVNVERSSPCYKCIIAMGLDKKPFPPKKKLLDADEEKKDFRGKKVSYKLTDKSIGAEENKDSVSMTSSPPEEETEFSGSSMEIEMEVQRRKGARIKWERNLRSIPDYAYDEDFEADEEKSDEKVNEEGQADDQMNGMSKSPSDDEKDNLDHEKESKNSSRKALQASDSERDESDGYSESDSGEEKQGKAADLQMVTAARKIQSFYRKHKGVQQIQRALPGRKCVPSLSSSSLVYSSENDSDHETRKQDNDKDIHSENENETPKNEGQETSLEEEDISATENATDKNGSSTSQENMMETNRQDITFVREMPKHIGSVDMNGRENREENLLVHLEGNIPEAEHRSKELSNTEDRGEFKSVKEKIAEASEKDHLLSSEPEDSYSSTEEEEENTISAQDKNEASDGASSAEELKMLESHKAAIQTEQDKEIVGKERTFEEEELLAEEGLKEAALEELSAKNVAVLPVMQAVKNELQIEVTELKKKAIVESVLEMDNTEKDIIYEEGEPYEGKVQVDKLKGTVLGDRACKREEMLEGYQVETKEVEGNKFTDGLMANEREPGGKAKVIENNITESRFLERVEYVNIELKNDSIVKAQLEVDIITIHKKEVVSEVSVLGRDGLVEEVSSDQVDSCLTEEELEETSQEVSKMQILSTGEDTALEKLNTWMEDPLLDWKTERGTSLTEEKNKDHGAKVTTEREEKGDKPNAEGDAVKGKLLVNKLAQEEENLMQPLEEEIEEELMEQVLKSEMSGPESKLVTKKEELFTEDTIEPEAIGMVTEEITMNTQQEGEVDGEESGKEGEVEVKRNAEAGMTKEGRKRVLRGYEEAEEAETQREVGSKWKAEVEEAEVEREVVVKQKAEAAEAGMTKEGRKGVFRGYEEAEEAETQREVGSKWKAEVEEAEVEREVVVKQKAEAAEARMTKEGRKRVLRGYEEAEEAETQREVGSKWKAEVEEAEVEREVVVKQKMEVEEAEVEREVVVKQKAEAAEAEVMKEGRKRVFKGYVEAEEAETQREVGSKWKAEVEEAEAERKMVLKGKAEVEESEIEKEESFKGMVDAEEAEAGKKMVLKGKVQAEDTGLKREVVDGEVDTEEAEARGSVVLKRKLEVEHPYTNGEALSVDARPKGQIVSDVSIQKIDAVTAEMVTDAKQVSGSSAQVVLGAGEESQESRKGNEARLQDEVETSEDTLRAETSVDALLQNEMVPVEDKEEAEEAGTEEERMGEELIPVKYVEEALLFGIQKLITEVSQISVEAMKDGFEDLVEQMSSHEDIKREDIFVPTVERQISLSDNSEERETKELRKVIHLEEKDKSGKSQIKQEESQTQNWPVAENFPVNTKDSETEQQQNITARMIYLEARISSDIEDRN
ncbi:glutamate-rich protein 3 [Heteronotia binoei]|uniref:glutamate-rich protein 3 n=1 Tax=Heteronotia binoei TaxID=13085 RepID=UPI002931B87B|nr:glutamate-rich protein 3 [Heteronotia binoei]